MILQTAGFFVALGFLAFIGGYMFNRPEIAMIGAVIVIGVGGTAMVDGLEVKTGEYKVATNTTNGTNTTIEYQYAPVETQSDFPVDFIILVLGTVMLLGATGEASEKELEDK
jgi:hypothetical protein